MKNMQRQDHTQYAVPEEDRWIVVEIRGESEGRRLDSVLAERLENMTRNHVQKLLEEGHVEAAGSGKAVKNYKVRVGDSFRVHIPAPEPLELLP